ncbi:TetR/AcrR family transcriptional regulator [Mycolicibacterium vulneris]|jgi:AcrR family transcriptional regulator|nr:TetR/AcrR family transcriptional regulator [Mycolicibacterium vulneris]
MYATATELFAQRGFAGTSLQDIADAMGITRPALYYYVKSKDDLLARLIAEITAGNTAQICEVAEDATLDPVAKLSRIAEIMALNRALQPSRFVLLARSEAALPTDLATIHETTKRTMLHTLIGVIRDGVDTRHFRYVEPRLAALQIIGMCNWVAWWFHEEDASSAEIVAADIADLVVAGLAQSGERAPAASGPRAALDLLRRDLDYLEHLIGDSEQPEAM